MTRPPGLPWAARAADALTVIAAVLAVTLLVAGPLRGERHGYLVVVSWQEMLFAAAAIAAVRHAALPRPSIRSTVTAMREAVRARPALADAWVAFWLTRPMVLIAGLLAVATFGIAAEAPQRGADRNLVRVLPARWDAQWYAGIAAGGYEWEHGFDRQQNLAFFPAYPAVTRAVASVTAVFDDRLSDERRLDRMLWSGLLVSLAAFFGAAVYLARLASETVGAERARAAVLLLAAYPYALFYSAAYTESLFLLAALGAWYHFRRSAWLPAVLWGLLAGASRPNGCFLSVPLGLLALGMRDMPGRTDDAGRGSASMLVRLAVAAAPGIGMLLFTLYLYQLTGTWFAWSRVHEAWGRVFGAESPAGLMDAFGHGSLVEFVTARPYDALNAIGLLTAIVLMRPVWRLSPAWAIFVAINVLAPLSAGGLMSMGRITSTLFPMFLALAVVLPPSAAPAVIAASAMLQGVLAALFYTWRPVF